MAPTETTNLLPTTEKKEVDGAPSGDCKVGTIFLTIQVVLLAFFVAGTTYSDEPYEVKEYIAFRDIMAMLLLGFGRVLFVFRNK